MQFSRPTYVLIIFFLISIIMVYQGVGAYTKEGKKLEKEIQETVKRVSEKTGVYI